MMEKKLRKYINRKFFLYPKAKGIIDIREELYSIMLDKYNDCLNFGMSEEESYKKAIEMTIDYKEAVKEVETGSSLSALKRNLISTASISSFYFMMLILIYLFVSMVVLKTFEKTWLITVGGVFAYFVYLSINAYKYAKLFNLKILARCGIALIYFSLIPLLYVFPSLYLSEVYLKNIWNHSWLIVLIILLFYVMTDYFSNRKHMRILEKGIHHLIFGFILTTILYFSISIWFHIWSIAWILYVAYLAIVSLAFYITEKMGKIIN